jgi:hypothetical protein
MIKVNKLHAEIKRRLNRVFSDYKESITVVDIDAYLNQAKEILLENFSTIVERNRTLSDRLRKIEVKNKELELKSSNNKTYTFSLPLDHYTTLNRYAIGKSKDCDKEDELFVNNIQTHKVEESLRDTNNYPDFNWRETFCNEDKEGINIYHGNILDVTKVYIDYLKWIPDVAFVSGTRGGLYINQEGDTINEDKHLMIDDKIVWLKIVDIAEYLIKKDLDDNYKVTMETILFNEKLHIT